MYFILSQTYNAALVYFSYYTSKLYQINFVSTELPDDRHISQHLGCNILCYASLEILKSFFRGRVFAKNEMHCEFPERVI